ncbi:MAG TPA: hypothetical protein P5080_00635 [Candidatus Paceibacterota bacterium]|nr:hypothetical protein [Candidatus Pacearchaeota archaeon]HRZ50482.1 hypothetical protein [Candidatus Paceibacterota bacterium]HSA36203.1 hypothetical protein [Candidatus Paceibacterota bacterium]
MDKWIFVVWLLFSLCWIDPATGKNWKKRSALGFVLGATLNGLFLYLTQMTLIPVNILLYLATNVACGKIFNSITNEFARFKSDDKHDRKVLPFFFGGVVLFCAMLGLAIISEPANTTALYNLAELEEPDLNLLNTSHIILISSNNAIRLGNNKLGELGNQAKIDEARWQVVNGKLNYLLPLAYAGTTQAWVLGNKGTEGYLMLSAENQSPEVQYVKGHSLRYIPSAIFGHDLKRHIWAKYPTFWQGDSIFQLDGNGNPIYVTVLDLPSVWGITGDKPAGIVVTDPETGQMAKYGVSEIPAWVQRSYEGETVTQYLRWWGLYPHGFWNTLFSKNGITAPVKDLSYRKDDIGEIKIVAGQTSALQPLCGNDGRLYYAAAMGNPNDDSHSLTAYVVANAAKLPIKLMLYPINESIDSLGAAQNIQQLDAVSHVPGHCVQPLNLYNISGKYAWLGPVATSYDEFAVISLTRLDNGKAYFGQNLADVYAKAGLDG